MTFAKPNGFNIPSPTAVVQAAKGMFRASRRESVLDRVEEPVQEDTTDRARYERLLERELDRQHLTAVEQEDSDALDRVRAALYEE